MPTTSNYDRTKRGLSVTRASDNVGDARGRLVDLGRALHEERRAAVSPGRTLKLIGAEGGT